MSKGPYKLRLDLRILDHLGINLYSNAAAVLSEAVANAWDADAHLVSVRIDPDADFITIEDNGIGMDLAQVNERFLNVGYNKLGEEGDLSPAGRRFMGRKGIGKLALFSIADEIEVHTRNKKERHAFVMRTADIRTAILKEGVYYPEKIDFSGPSRGTRIVLKELKKKRTATSIAGLRKRISRRFSVIGIPDASGKVFEVRVNDEPVGPEDREDLRSVEFMWEFGKKTIDASDCPILEQRFIIESRVDKANPDWIVRGWLGAVDEPKRLRQADMGPLNNIVVLARGRLIQENILDQLGFSRILNSYLTGQVEADFLADKDRDDIATSDRQRLVEDDERYRALIHFLRDTLKSIQDQWTDLRNAVRGKQAVNEVPALSEWLDSLPTSVQKNAQKLLGLIRGVELENEDERKDLYKSGMLGFERLRLREESHLLSGSEELTAAALLPLLADFATLEASMYREIVKVRLDVIKEFEQLVDENEKEKLLQTHLFSNLWLLDTGWERAAGSERIEERLKSKYKAFKPTLTDKQSKGRVDIRYKTNAGEHIIVELKRAGRIMKLGELVDQGTTYKHALIKCLALEGDTNPNVSVVFVVGRPIAEESEPGGATMVRDALRAMNARAIHYETLIQKALAQYGSFLDESKKNDRIERILKKM